MDKIIGIIGYGEIGQAVESLYDDSDIVVIYDPAIDRYNYNTVLYNVDILHICYPYFDNFVKETEKYIKYSTPKLTIIHSTLPVGTTKQINDGEIGRGKVVYSPVMGIHPMLYDSLKTFTKLIGADEYKQGLRVKKHFKELGINSEIVGDTKTAELGKLLDTTYYAHNIVFAGFAKSLCDGLGVRYEDAYVKFNQEYNKGYSKLGKTNVIRPILQPPGKKIGGHCLIPNAKILKKQVNTHPILEEILSYDDP